jgi:2-octaprenylphenol hydroxylase
MRDLDAVIVGGGTVGATMAALLIRQGLVEAKRVALIDESFALPPGDEADWDLRVVALSRASERLLRHVGAWRRLPPARICAYESMCVWDASGTPDGAGSIRFEAADLGEPNLGAIVENRALKQACLESATAAGALLIEARLMRLDPLASGVRLVLEDGRELEAGLVVAADGVASKTRALLGIETAGHAYHQDAMVLHVRTARPHRSTAWQRFLPGGPLAFLPLPDGRSSIVWSVPRAEAQRLRGLDAADIGAALTDASDGALGAIEVTTPVLSFPLRLQYAERYIGTRAVLLGDAAHVVHPLAGQGLNLGLLDCAALAECLGPAASLKLVDQAVLRRYERWRRSENLLAAAALDGLERLFSNRHPLTRRIRALGLGGVGRLPLLRNHLARRALGLAGDVPALLRREPAVASG